jgi:hypothetical protein
VVAFPSIHQRAAQKPDFGEEFRRSPPLPSIHTKGRYQAPIWDVSFRLAEKETESATFRARRGVFDLAYAHRLKSRVVGRLLGISVKGDVFCQERTVSANKTIAAELGSSRFRRRRVTVRGRPRGQASESGA